MFPLFTPTYPPTHTHAHAHAHAYTHTHTQTLSLPASTHLYPFTLSSQQILMAQATTEEEQSLISEIVYTDFSLADYHRKNYTLTFAVGESSHRFVVDIIDDVIPEVGEGFSVGLEGPVVGGARLGDQQSIDVTILTNDDAHGRIGFAPVSLVIERIHLHETSVLL